MYETVEHFLGDTNLDPHCGYVRHVPQTKTATSSGPSGVASQRERKGMEVTSGGDVGQWQAMYGYNPNWVSSSLPPLVSLSQLWFERGLIDLGPVQPIYAPHRFFEFLGPQLFQSIEDCTSSYQRIFTAQQQQHQYGHVYGSATQEF